MPQFPILKRRNERHIHRPLLFSPLHLPQTQPMILSRRGLTRAPKMARAMAIKVDGGEAKEITKEV